MEIQTGNTCVFDSVIDIVDSLTTTASSERGDFNDRQPEMATETGNAYTSETWQRALKYKQQIWSVWPWQVRKRLLWPTTGSGNMDLKTAVAISGGRSLSQSTGNAVFQQAKLVVVELPSSRPSSLWSSCLRAGQARRGRAVFEQAKLVSSWSTTQDLLFKCWCSLS